MPSDIVQNQVLERILREQRVLDPSGNTLPLHSHLPAEEGRILQGWVREYKPRRLLEIGLAYGVSSLFICDAIQKWPPDRYHTIDAFQVKEWSGIGVQHLQEAGYWDHITLYEERSEKCLPALWQAGYRYDFAYVDGWHSFDQVMLEFFYINRMMDSGGIVVFDDVHLPSLQKVLAYIGQYPCYRALPLPERVTKSMPAKVRRAAGIPPVRIAGLVKVARDERNWDWFEDF